MVGVAQLKKLDSFTARRRENWSFLRERLTPMALYLALPEALPDARPSWFGFLMTVKDGSPVSREGFVSHLEAHNIQTRPLFARNLVRHPCFQNLRGGIDYRIAAPLTVTDQIMRSSFWVGVYPGMERAMLDEIASRILKIGDRHGL